MSLLGKRFEMTPERAAVIKEMLATAEPVKVERDAWFKCPSCGHAEQQPKTVSAVYHRCPNTKTLKELIRG